MPGESRTGRFQAVLVEGEAGIGKTRVLEGTTQRVRQRGFRVFVGRSDEVQRARPFGPLSEALGRTPNVDEPRRAEIVRLLTRDQGARGQMELTLDAGVQFRIVDAFVDLVEGVALAGPVASVLEDPSGPTHRPSSRSARSLGEVRASRVVGELACRARALPPRTARRQLGARRAVQAGSLSVGGGDDLLPRTRLRAAPGPALLEEVAGAAGNPLFVGASSCEGTRTTGCGPCVCRRTRIDPRALPLPPSLRLTILRRLSSLDVFSSTCFESARPPPRPFPCATRYCARSLRDRALATSARGAPCRSVRGARGAVRHSGTTSSGRRSTRTSQRTPAQPSTSRPPASLSARGLQRPRLPSSSPSARNRETSRRSNGCTLRRTTQRAKGSGGRCRDARASAGPRGYRGAPCHPAHRPRARAALGGQAAGGRGACS